MGPQDECTLTFRDGAEQWKSSFVTSHDSTRDVTVLGDISLSDFFARPVKIAEYVWDPASIISFYQAFDPWTLFLSNPRVSNRVSNYRLMSAKLHVKMLINGNPFYYGRLLAHYTPLPQQDTISIWSDTSTNALMQASQGLHAYIDPTPSQGCEFELPFVWNYDMIDLFLGQQNQLGNMYIREMFPLKHANGALNPLNIQVYAWMSEVKLSVPTVNEPTFLTPQGGKYKSTKGNEYASSPVSTMASAAAGMMGKLSNVPILGGYAKASEMVMNGIAGVARLFGFSRPAIIDDYIDMRPSYISRLAVTNAGDNVAKLTVDGKQELTIDPAVVGIGAEDELVLSSIASKESWLTNFVWPVSGASGATLFSIRVAPIWKFANNNWYIPAVTYASLPFKYWHGTIKYRFQIVASQYHRGRMLIVWDPIAQTGAPESNVQYSKIIDLSNERDFTFEVGWGSAKRWLNRPTFNGTNYFSNAIAFPTELDTCNGVVSVYILNDLTSPNSSINNDIGVNVFISGCDDIEFAVPDTSVINKLTTVPAATPQSGTFEEIPDMEVNAPIIEKVAETIADCLPSSDPTPVVYMGEQITSFRQMMKRYTLWGSFYDPTATAAYTQVAMSDFPNPRGYDSNGTTLNVANYYNPTVNTTLNYLSFAFLAYRGGVRRKYVFTSGVTGNTMAYISRVGSLLSRSPAVLSVAKTVSTALAFSQQQTNTIKRWIYEGAHMTTMRQQPVLEVEFPFYTNARFVSPRLQATTTAPYTNVFSPLYMNHILYYEHDATPSSFDVFVAATLETNEG